MALFLLEKTKKLCKKSPDAHDQLECVAPFLVDAEAITHMRKPKLDCSSIDEIGHLLNDPTTLNIINGKLEHFLQPKEKTIKKKENEQNH